VKTYPLELLEKAPQDGRMFLQCTKRKKDGKEHCYYSGVESRRIGHDQVTQRTVLYLGESNELQEAAWQELLEDVERESAGEAGSRSRAGHWFGLERPEVPDLDPIRVKLEQMELRRPRAFGNCWLACAIWGLLGLEGFWEEKLPEGHEGVAWSKVARLLVVLA
jgi:hypothetical protein